MIGIIGAGNMGSAIVEGILNNGLCYPGGIIASDKNAKAIEKLSQKYGIRVSDNNIDALECEVLFLAVKPQILYNVIEEIKYSVSPNTIIVSIAAGQNIKKIEDAFEQKIKLVRAMPNTPAVVGEAMSALSTNRNVTKEESERVVEIFECFGKAEVVPENLMDAITAVSGSSPAYIFMLIEAMADAAVSAGMPRGKAYTFAAQSVLGSAKMVLETKTHPGKLKDMVCSPGGTTIEAVKVLEEKGFRSAIISAMDACAEKSRSM